MKQNYTIHILLLAMVVVLLSSCVGDDLISDSASVVAGKPATISFKVQIPGMDVRTRTMGIGPDDADASTVKHLWVGIYNVDDGKRVGEEVFTEPDPYKELTLGTLSGNCRIVGVANSQLINGTKIDEDGNSGKENLLKLLNGATTWDDFLKISVVLSQSDLIVRYSASQFVMCGYMKGADGGETVTIQEGDNRFPNPIELHRLDAHVKMNFYPGTNVTIKPISFQVCNIPGVSYLYEQEGNAGDNKINAENKLWESESDEVNSSYYHHSPIYIGSSVDQIFDDNFKNVGYTFEFLQRENKHKGIISEQNEGTDYYHVREIEEKDDNGENTGKYINLAEKDQAASYVVFEAEVSYWCDDQNFLPVSESTAKDKSGYYFRTANVKYTIHLGYIEDKLYGIPTLATANDFNCRRNTRYTYNIHIDGVDKVRIEAQSDELTPGAEGWVSDVKATGITLDSHYSVFNVEMSDAERANLVWRIQSPYGNNTIDLLGGYASKGVGDDSRLQGLGTIDIRSESNKNIKGALAENQFYNWIQIRPTTDKDKIADYPGHPVYSGGYASSGTDNKVWDLEAFANPSEFMHTDITENQAEYKKYLENPDEYQGSQKDAFKDMANKTRPYTFFIDEYVYEHDYDENAPSKTGNLNPANWDNYANKTSRKLWLSLDEVDVSTDFESSYARAEYVIEQRAVQTFSPFMTDTSEGIGVEHLNESFVGRWPNWDESWTPNGEYGWAIQKDYVDKKSLTWTYLFGEEQGGARFRKGTSDINKTDIQSYQDAETFYIPDYETWRDGYTTTGDTHNYMKACLARNRDLDGDGVIDDNEIRWYLPTSEIYAQMMLGMRSLETPLFNVREVPQQGFLSPGFGHEGIHYTASDGKRINTEDMVAIFNARPDYAKQIRCVRTLGQDNRNGSDEPKTTIYIKRNNGNIIDINYASENNYKPMTEELAAHEITDQLSFPYKAFEFAEGDCKSSNTQITQDIWDRYNFQFGDDGAINGYDMIYYGANDWEKTPEKDRQKTIDIRNRWEDMVNNDNICRYYSQNADKSDLGTWRMPNISELVILGFLNGLNNGVNYISCSYDYLKGAIGKTGTSAGGANTDADYGDGRFLGVQIDKDGNVSAGAYKSPLYIRCVRDVTAK